MTIGINSFGGMVPRLAPEQLPENGARDARNVDLSKRVLTPLNVLNPLLSLHDPTTGAMNAELTTDDLMTIAQPAAPDVATGWPKKMADPVGGAWLTIRVFWFATFTDTSTETSETGIIQRPSAEGGASHNLTIDDVEITESQMIVRATLPSMGSIPMEAGIIYDIHGPIYQVIVTEDADGSHGGPTISGSFPEVPNYGDGHVFRAAIPLQYSPVSANPAIYGVMELDDVAGPDYTSSDRGTDIGGSYGAPGGQAKVVFHFNMNYRKSAPETFRFSSTNVDVTGGVEREGPESDPSEVITVNPGEAVKLDITVTQERANLYRTNPQSGAWELVKRLAATPTKEIEWYSTDEEIVGSPLPDLGDYTATGASEARFLEGSVLHPAGFAVCFTNDTTPGAEEYIVWPSVPYELHAYPEHYAVQLDQPIVALAISGYSVIAWTQDPLDATKGNVYEISGTDPSRMICRLLADHTPILGATPKTLDGLAGECKGLARLGQTLFWPTNDGLAAFGGGGVEIVTREHFTRNEWDEYDPDAFEATTGDQSIFLENDDPTLSLRFELGEGVSAVTRWTALTGGAMLWESRTWKFERAEIFDHVFIVADGNVTLTVWVDGVKYGADGVVDAAGYTITPETWTRLAGLPHGFQWRIRLECAAAVRSVSMVERRIVSVDGGQARISGDASPLWEDLWIKFPDRDRFVAGHLSAQIYPVTLTFKNEAGTTLFTEVVADGHLFTFPRSTTTNPALDIVRVQAPTEARVDALTLFTRTSVKAGKVLQLTQGAFAPWLVQSYEFPEADEPVSGYLKADSYPRTLNLYAEGAATPTVTITVADGAEFRIDGLGRPGMLELDLNGDDHIGSELILFQKRVVPVKGTGIILRGVERSNWRRLFLEFPDLGSFGVARVVTSSTTGMYLRLYANNQLQASPAVTSEHEFKLPLTLINSRGWEIDIPHAARIDELHLISRMRHTIRGGRFTIEREGEPFSFLGHYLIAPSPVSLSCARVWSDRYPVTLVFRAEDNEIARAIADDDRPLRLPKMGRWGMLELDAAEADTGAYIHRVAVATGMELLR